MAVVYVNGLGSLAHCMAWPREQWGFLGFSYGGAGQVNDPLVCWFGRSPVSGHLCCWGLSDHFPFLSDVVFVYYRGFQILFSVVLVFCGILLLFC